MDYLKKLINDFECPDRAQELTGLGISLENLKDRHRKLEIEHIEAKMTLIKEDYLKNQISLVNSGSKTVFPFILCIILCNLFYIIYIMRLNKAIHTAAKGIAKSPVWPHLPIPETSLPLRWSPDPSFPSRPNFGFSSCVLGCSG